MSVGLTLSALVAGVGSAAAQTASPPNVAYAANVFHPDQASLDHFLLLVDKVIDPTSIPAPADFSVRFEGVTTTPTSVEFLYAGFAGPGSAFNEAGIGFVKIGINPIPISQLTDGVDAFTIDYTPGAAPIRDRALAIAPAVTELPVETIEATGMDLIAGTIDHDYGADKLLLFFSQPVELSSIPPASDFTVTVENTTVTPAAVRAVLTDLGVGVLELRLPSAVPAGTEGSARVVYTPNGAPVVGRFDAAVLPAFDIDWVYYFLPANGASATVGAGGSVTTAGGGVSESDPVATTVTSPVAGTVTIKEKPLEDPAPTGYAFFGQLVEITAPAATDPTNPLVFTFELHASLVPDGESAQTIQMARNGVPVPICSTSGPTPVASPSPCIWQRVDHLTGNVSITVATLEASRWSFALRTPVSFVGFGQPVDNRARNGVKAGAAVPIVFSLGGYRGLDVFAAGSPSSRSVTCDTGTPFDDISAETTTAGKSGLSYDSVSDTYTYVWKTARAWSGCRELTVVFYDGTTRKVTFEFKH
ncbi:MAG: PxKF domain-containing protein [Chloroflexi bacterium]|nr:PxKF domain-containing protein [Chloroflexota bacterium]